MDDILLSAGNYTILEDLFTEAIIGLTLSELVQPLRKINILLQSYI